MTGFEQMGFEIVLFEDLDNVIPEMNREDIVVGGIETVRKRLAQLGIGFEEINYPAPIRKYLGRKIWRSKIDTINSHPEQWPVFVKSIEGKGLRGKSLIR